MSGSSRVFKGRLNLDTYLILEYLERCTEEQIELCAIVHLPSLHYWSKNVLLQNKRKHADVGDVSPRVEALVEETSSETALSGVSTLSAETSPRSDEFERQQITRGRSISGKLGCPMLKIAIRL